MKFKLKIVISIRGFFFVLLQFVFEKVKTTSQQNFSIKQQKKGNKFVFQLKYEKKKTYLQLKEKKNIEIEKEEEKKQQNIYSY